MPTLMFVRLQEQINKGWIPLMFLMKSCNQIISKQGIQVENINYCKKYYNNETNLCEQIKYLQ